MQKKQAKNLQKRIQLTPTNRISMLICYIVQLILFAMFQLIMFHYIYMPLPFLFSAPSLGSEEHTEDSKIGTYQKHYLWNGMLYSLFFVQHVVMSLIIFKLSLKSLWNKYPLFQRYIYNISSCLAEFLIFYNAKPTSAKQTIIFTTPISINLFFNIIAIIVLTLAIVKFGGDLLSPYSIKQIIKDPYIQYQPYNESASYELTSTGVYGYCRHPMQGSIIVLLLFVSNVYTVDRVIFILVNVLGVFVGVYYEEQKLRVKFKGYREYERKVPYKFVPYVV